MDIDNLVHISEATDSIEEIIEPGIANCKNEKRLQQHNVKE
jgi:hypothetical protein